MLSTEYGPVNSYWYSHYCFQPKFFKIIKYTWKCLFKPFFFPSLISHIRLNKETMLLWFCFAFKCNTHLLGANSAVFSPIWKIRTRKKTGSPRSKSRCYNACFLQLIGVPLGYWRQVMWPLCPCSKFKWVSPDKSFYNSVFYTVLLSVRKLGSCHPQQKAKIHF